MEIEFSQEQLNEIKKDDYFSTMEHDVQEILDELKTFAHQEDCKSNDQCPYICCHEQLSPMTAIVWDISEVLNELTYLLHRLQDDDRALEEDYMYLMRVRETVSVINDVLWFVYRADGHEKHTHREDYWYWTKIVDLRSDFNALRYRFMERLEENGAGYY